MYSVNQVNQLYVVSAITDSAVTSASAAGTVRLRKSQDGWFQYLQHVGKKGTLTATDRIKKCKVKYVTYTPAEAMRKPLRIWTITMNSDVNSGNPVPGQDYIINFSFRSYFGMSDEDIYDKFAVARAKNTNASDLLKSLAVSLAKNFSREVDLPFSIAVQAGTGAAVEVTPTTKEDKISGTVDKIILTEKIQPWELGRFKLTRPDFTIRFTGILVDGLEVNNWGKSDETASTGYIGNGMETADLEWFCHGERGDQYRGKDWPLSITTPADFAMVDPDKEYDYLIVHFWDDIDNEAPQKSERDLTLVADKSASVDLDSLAKTIAANAGLDHYTKVELSSGKYVPKAEPTAESSSASEDA